ncbi:hypothetical protein CATYP_04840 [Corynebacterium atypicum]|uniref:Uncharacterized protein n=1 Tax=Corynebacterium atypicum TaxID=191610 RepID=A0ABM5QMS3_9CORY|nr:hypothetical protein [Corynebacterium atypicum]AIG64067.1 hypothetical protein CATYP_04840 [Corynebacterium atypicum]
MTNSPELSAEIEPLAQRVAEALIALGEPAWPTSDERIVSVVKKGKKLQATALGSVLIVACEQDLQAAGIPAAEPGALAANRYIATSYGVKAVVRRIPAQTDTDDAAATTVVRTESSLICSPGISDAQLHATLPEMIGEVAEAQQAIAEDATRIAAAAG